MIRMARPSDAKAIAQVHVSSWQEAYCDLMPTEYLNSLEATLAQRESFWVRSIESGEPCVLVEELNEQVVGWISVGASRDEDTAATLDRTKAFTQRRSRARKTDDTRAICRGLTPHSAE